MIYIQSDSERTLAHHFDASCALYGAIETGRPYRLTSIEEIVAGKFDALIRQRLFVGSTEFMREVFKRIGLEDVRLPANSNRGMRIISLRDALNEAAEGKKLFIKPKEIKLFSGFVLDGSSYSCLHGLPDDTQLMADVPFESRIASEWRLYVHNNKIIDSRNYAGDFTLGPDYSFAKQIAKENIDSFPCAYTIDIGILESGENVVIEYNDMWAIGNYGMENDKYLKLLTDRYFEIVRG